MRSIHAALLAFLLAPGLAPARAWKGIDPGASTQGDVVQRFGEPTARTKRGERTVLAYYADQALEGTRQTQFHVDAEGTVVEITIFLTAHLDAESIEGTYGKPPKRTFVEDTFQKVWLYPDAGVTVYFDKEGNVQALSFGPGARSGRKAAAAAQDAGAAARPASAR